MKKFFKHLKFYKIKQKALAFVGSLCNNYYKVKLARWIDPM